ncbi:MAG: hypothetical protein NC131_07820 [Roseburia sp.]|nr:hypothetical protein [Roseburia sp.]
MKASQIFCTEISSKDKKKRGYVLAVSCVKDMIEGYICCNENETEFFAESAGCQFSGGAAIFSVTGKENKKGYRLKLGIPVFSEAGKFLGQIDDYTIKDNRIVYANSCKRKFPFNRLILGDVAILKSGDTETEIVAKDMFIDAIINS